VKISGNNWEITKKHLIMQLDDPFWSAWQRYGWPQGTAGYSVSSKAIDRAKKLNKKILVKNKYGWYEITPNKALQYSNNQFITGNGTKLLCLPSTAFKKIQKPINEEVQIDSNARAKLATIWKEKYGKARS